MAILKEDPHRTIILGAGQGGTAILEMLLDEALVDVLGIVDTNPKAPGLALAEEKGIKIYNNVEQAIRENTPCVAFNMTRNEMVETIASDLLGAGGVIGGLEANLIWSMVTNLKKTKAELEFQASHDALTSLYNRRHITEHLHQGISQAQRYHHPYTVVMIDLDHFKNVNDTHGHAVGDLVLTQMAKVLKNSVRESDIAGRWGGEEFIVLLPHTDLPGTCQAAEQWLKNIADSPVILDNGKSIHITFSAGIATLNADMAKLDIQYIAEELLNKADERMYAAKAQGRNRICGSSHKKD